MPTPFMHLALAERLAHDPELPTPARDLMRAAWGAFLLGSIAPDARVSGGLPRSGTHFFHYGPTIAPRPAAAMLAAHPELRRPALARDAAHAAFVAGYCAHLTMDEIWCVKLLFPYFIIPGGPSDGLLTHFHVFLGNLDARDRRRLPAEQYEALRHVTPHGWTPFLPDPDLAAWREVVAPQLAPDGKSLTLSILARVLHVTPQRMAELMADRALGEEVARLLPAPTLARLEEAIYAGVRDMVARYVSDEVDTAEATV
ncbi:MAG: hypothetical protein IT323_14250 [Anaerolineae bacterium]|nr:hypothetical protein [Anaerolineae bacterium]